MAQSLDRKGDVKDAIAAYLAVLRDDQDNLEALRGLALDYLFLNDFTEALPVQEKIVALDPKDAQTRVELAFNYLNHQKEPAKAVEYLTQAVVLEPSAKNLTFLGQAQIVAADLSGAEQTLGKALKTDPKYPHSYIVLLSLLESQKRNSDVAKLRERAHSNGVDLSQTT